MLEMYDTIEVSFIVAKYIKFLPDRYFVILKLFFEKCCGLIQ